MVHIITDDPDVLDHAADIAEAEGDREHARDLRKRAQRARRINREQRAGIKQIPWHFPKSFYEDEK